MKNLMKIFILVLIVELAIISGVYYFFDREINYVNYSQDNFSCEIPSPYEEKGIFEYGWHKHKFRSKGTIYISHLNIEEDNLQDTDIFSYFEQYIYNKVYEKKIKIYNDGKFYLCAKGKLRTYIYIFTVDDEVFWLENTVYNSTLITYKKVLDHILISFAYKGKRVNPEIKNKIEYIDKQIIRYSQDIKTILIAVIGVSLIIFILVGFILYRSSKIPERFRKIFKRKQESIYIVIKGMPGYKGTLGWIGLTDTELIIKPVGRRLSKLKKQDVKNIILDRKRKEYIIVETEKFTYKLYIDNIDSWMAEIKNLKE